MKRQYKNEWDSYWMNTVFYKSLRCIKVDVPQVIEQEELSFL